MFQYNVEANKAYILRVKFFSTSATGNIKIGITPAQGSYDVFEDISHSTQCSNWSFATALDKTYIKAFTPSESGTYTFRTDYPGSTFIDTCVYVIDTFTNSAYLYDDDSAGDLQALISTNLVAGRTYLVIVSPYNIHTTSGSIMLYISKQS